MSFEALTKNSIARLQCCKATLILALLFLVFSKAGWAIESFQPLSNDVKSALAPINYDYLAEIREQTEREVSRLAALTSGSVSSISTFGGSTSFGASKKALENILDQFQQGGVAVAKTKRAVSDSILGGEIQNRLTQLIGLVEKVDGSVSADQLEQNKAELNGYLNSFLSKVPVYPSVIDGQAIDKAHLLSVDETMMGLNQSTDTTNRTQEKARFKSQTQRVKADHPQRDTCYAEGEDDQKASDLDTNDFLHIQSGTLMRNKASELDHSPIKIFNFVRNEVRLVHDLGSTKGALKTLESMSGSATDIASLTIALLRNSGIPARYKHIKAKLYNREDHLSWFGETSLEGLAVAVNHVAHPPVDIQELDQSGNVQVNSFIPFNHMIVSACLPYSNYRGTASDGTGYKWTSFDPSYRHMKPKSSYLDHDVDYQKFLSNQSNKLLGEAFYDELVKLHAQQNASFEVDDVDPVLGTAYRYITKEFDHIPELPYEYENYGDDESELTALGERHPRTIRVRMVAGSDPNNIIFDEPAITHVAGDRLTVYFDAESSSDDLIGSWRRGETSLSCASGEGPRFDIIVDRGGKSVPMVPMCTNGEFSQIVITAAEYFYDEQEITQFFKLKSTLASPLDVVAVRFEHLDNQPANIRDKIDTLNNYVDGYVGAATIGDRHLGPLMGSFLDVVASKYNFYFNSQYQKFSAFMGTRYAKPGVVTFTKMKSDIRWVLGVPYVIFSSRYVIDTLASVTYAHTNDEKRSKLLRNILYHGSQLESTIWQENLNSDAVSTITGLQYYNEVIQQPLIELNAGSLTLLKDSDSSNDPIVVCQVSADDCYLQKSVDLLVKILEKYPDSKTFIQLPIRPLKYRDWVGLVYTAELFEDGLLSNVIMGIGEYNGGHSVDTPLPALWDETIDTSDPGYNYDEHQDTGYDFEPQYYDEDGNYIDVGDGVNSVVNVGESHSSTFAGDPVNMVTGNMYLKETDFVIKSQGGMPIVFSRSYNSLREHENGPLGYGWTHSFNQKLKFIDTDENNKTDTIIWVDASGGERAIKLNERAINDPLLKSQNKINLLSGDAIIPDGFYFSLERPYGEGSTSFILTEKNGTKFIFEAKDGRIDTVAQLEAIQDRVGNRIRIELNNGEIDYVQAPDGRILDFSYKDGLLESILFDWTSNGRHFLYTEKGELRSVGNYKSISDPKNGLTYTYFDDSDYPGREHLMESHTGADNSSYTYKYYLNGKVQSHIDSLGHERQFYYNDYRRETVTIDERGKTTSYFFNEHGLPLRVNKPDGGQDLYQYKDSNDPMLRTSSSNLYGLETINEYDTAGNVVKMTLPSQNTVEYFYFTPFGQPQIIKNAAGDYTLNKHNALGQLTDSVIFVKGYGSQIDPGNVVIEDHASNILLWSHYEYDNYGNLSFVRQIDDFTNPNSGPSTVFEYNDTKNNIDGVNRVKAHYYGDIDGLGIISDGEGLGSFDYEYNPLSLVTKGFDSQFYPVENKYNRKGKVVWGTDQLGNQRDYFYDPRNKLTNNSLVVTKPEGIALIDQLSYEYDDMGRLTQTMNNEGVPIVYEYDSVGNTKKIIAADGFWVGYEHDPSNRVTRVFDEEGNAYQKLYDQLGRTRKEIDPEGLSLEYEYYGPEQDGRVKAVHGINGRSTYFVYNALGLVTKTTSKGRFGSSGGPPDQVQEVVYDAMGRPTYTMSATMEDSVLGSLKSVTHYQYDTLGNKTHTYAGWTKTGSPQAATLKFQEALVYDDFGRVKVRVDALNKTWRYTYDVHSNVKEVEEPNGRLLEFEYGYGGLLKSKKKSDNSDYVVYVRNELGQIKSVVTPAVDYAYTYDAGHRIKKMTDKRRNKDIVYHYTLTGMLDRVDDPEKGTVRMIYDPARRLTGVRTQDYKTIHYVRDKAGRITEEVFPNGVTTSYSFKPNTVLLEEVETANRDTGELLHSANYTYSEGLLQSETLSTPSSSLSRTYQYDALGRIQVSLQANGDTHIGYDPFGNRRYVQETGKPREIYIHNDGHQLKEIRRNSETGTLLSEFEYDDYGNMLSRQDIDQPKLTLTYDSWDRLKMAEKAGSDSQAYEYDHLNRRVAKTVGTEKTHYVYAGANIAATYDKSWTQMERFAYGQGVDDPVVQFSGASDDPLYFHQDRMGSVVATSGPSGQMLASAMYDAWGNIENSTGAKAPSFGYTGREHDETGLIYNRARYYDPSIGRFISADPMGFINGVNRYTYALNNPAMFVDPWGYSASSFTDTLSGSLYDAAGTVIRTVAELVPYVESVNNIIIDHDVDLAVENAAIESGMILAGAVSGGTALGAYKVGKVVDGLADAAVAISKIFCSFDEDTLVSTPDGFKAIGALSVGDLVLAKEPITGIVTQKPIKGVFDEAHDEVIKLTLRAESGEEVITTTREHPFYVEHIGWVSAGELWIGVRLQSLHGHSIEVTNIETIEGDFKARNIYVDDFHTYAVGESEAWVHNACKIPNPGGRLGNQSTRNHIDNVATEMESRGWTITGGGNRRPEEYLAGPGGGRKGSSYPDITATKGGNTLRVNTVDTRSDGITPSTREAANADRIRLQTPGDHLLLIPKP